MRRARARPTFIPLARVLPGAGENMASVRVPKHALGGLLHRRRAPAQGYAIRCVSAAQRGRHSPQAPLPQPIRVRNPRGRLCSDSSELNRANARVRDPARIEGVKPHYPEAYSNRLSLHHFIYLLPPLPQGQNEALATGGNAAHRPESHAKRFVCKANLKSMVCWAMCVHDSMGFRYPQVHSGRAST